MTATPLNNSAGHSLSAWVEGTREPGRGKYAGGMFKILLVGFLKLKPWKRNFYFDRQWPNQGLTRPLFAGERLVQMLGCFFMCIQGFIEHFLRFLRRDVSNRAMKTPGVVPIDPFQRLPFKLAQ